MTDYGTIKLPRDTYEQHNERRQELGLTWAEYVDGQAPDLPQPEPIDHEALAAAVVDRMDVHEFASQAADEVETRLR